MYPKSIYLTLLIDTSDSLLHQLPKKISVGYTLLISTKMIISFIKYPILFLTTHLFADNDKLKKENKTRIVSKMGLSLLYKHLYRRCQFVIINIIIYNNFSQEHLNLLITITYSLFPMQVFPQ